VTLLGADGALLVTGALPVGSGFVLADGAFYTADGDTVVALGLPDLTERWRVPAAIEHDMDAIDGGFVSRVGDEVRAYLS
jgi:hypothetical protein